MVKSSGGGNSTGLNEIVEQLKANNKLVDQQNTSIQQLLDETRDASAREKKALVAENRQKSIEKKSRLERMKENRLKPNSITGNFVRGAVGGTAYTGLRKMTDGFGGLGLGTLARGLARVAGSGLLFGGLIMGANKVAQGVLDNVFENVDPEKDLGFADQERAKKKLIGGMNTALGMKFLGFRGRTSLLAGIGIAFSDQITSWMADKLDTTKLSPPEWMKKTFGLTEGQLEVDLKDPKVAAAIGAATSLVAGQIAIKGAETAVKTTKNFVVSKIGSGRGKMDPTAAWKEFSKNQNKKLYAGRGPMDPTDSFRNRYNNPNAPRVAPKLSAGNFGMIMDNIDDVDNLKMSQFTDDLLRMQKSGATVGGIKMGSGPGGRPMYFDDATGRYKFASKVQVQKALVEANEKMQDAKKRILKAENRYASRATAARSSRIKNLFKMIQKSTIAQRALSFGSKIAGPASFAFTGAMGVLDEERAKAGQGATARTIYGMGEGVTGLLDFVVNGTYGTVMKGINLAFEKAGSDMRVQDTFDYTGIFRSSTFVLHNAFKQALHEYLSVSDKELKDLTLQGSGLPGGNLLITNQQIREGSVATNNNFNLNGGGLGDMSHPYAGRLR